MKSEVYKSFFYLESGEVLFNNSETNKYSNKLFPGLYNIDYHFITHTVIINQILSFEKSKKQIFEEKKQIDNLIESFFDEKTKKRIENIGFAHKIGILLYGNEGTGKTSIINYYCSEAILNNDAIVFNINCTDDNMIFCWQFIDNIRKIQENPIIVVFDEFDKHVIENESVLKSITDGNWSISNCIFFAATNYIEKIPEALKNRPSRFKYVINIGSITDESYVHEIVSNILKDTLTDDEIIDIANNLNGETLDNIKQYCFDILMNIKHYERKKKSIGFKV